MTDIRELVKHVSEKEYVEAETVFKKVMEAKKVEAIQSLEEKVLSV